MCCCLLYNCVFCVVPLFTISAVLVYYIYLLVGCVMSVVVKANLQNDAMNSCGYCFFNLLFLFFILSFLIHERSPLELANNGRTIKKNKICKNNNRSSHFLSNRKFLLIHGRYVSSFWNLIKNCRVECFFTDLRYIILSKRN